MGTLEVVIVLVMGGLFVVAGIALHWCRGEIVGKVKGLLQGEAEVPGSTPSIIVRRFADADGKPSRAEMQVGVLLAGDPFRFDPVQAEGLARLLREADAFVQGKA